MGLRVGTCQRADATPVGGNKRDRATSKASDPHRRSPRDRGAEACGSDPSGVRWGPTPVERSLYRRASGRSVQTITQMQSKDLRETITVEIRHYQHTAPLADLFLAEARTLPQNAATAAAQLAAILARNPSRGRWPGVYVVRITPDDDSGSWTLPQDDPAVAEAVRVLREFGLKRPYKAGELATARAAAPRAWLGSVFLGPGLWSPSRRARCPAAA